ncbi:tRNA lysidine(34) synthetase TilS [Erythrobacter sp. SCSIO 43205]|uniref:tRNA lysidine(34) synthetase TilS n=1 Tax=Erythrobacter sp. SCSIO 43205 TaxID=2779361 RepID=UPI001CA7CCD1|nr:tRNA lysidine(34) synthetase TilS [Erythrobacter sp. SCSIO 43205]UAB77942.1 tRNA lysidine(34) synthetase TilS [Erythrobacter sp. SCSIO 43205]
MGLAVSGGPDSLALLVLAAIALPGEIAVMSVDHSLRKEAEAEVALVESVCAALNVPFTPAKVHVGGGNLQAKAREARYTALGDWAIEQSLGAVATAHHMDDAAETLLMRLARGSGLAGLAGVRAFAHVPGYEDVPLVRPLLDFRKAELECVVEACGITPVRDPSNEDSNFERVRVRRHIAEHEWLAPEALARSAQHLAEGWRALEWYAQIDWEEMVTREDTDDAGFRGAPQYRYFCNVPRAIQVETVCRIVSELGGRVTRSEAGVAADRLWRGENASLGGVLARPGVEKVAKVGVEMRVWRFSSEPPRAVH